MAPQARKIPLHFVRRGAAPHLTSDGEKSIIKRGGAPHSEKRGTHL